MIRPYFRASMVLAAVLTVLLSAGCGTGSGTGGSSGLEKPDLTVAAVPAFDSAGLYIAQQRGLFAAQGLHVTIVPAISSATVIAGQLAGKYDVTLGAYPSYILADALRGKRFRVLAAASNMGQSTQEVMVPPGSTIQNMGQLKGKRIGVNALNNLGTLLVSSLLSDYGVQATSVHFVVIPFPEMAAAMKAHKVDAAWLPEPFITGAEESLGATELADANQGATQGLPVSGFMVTQDWENKYPKTAAAFRRAVVAAQALANTSLSAVQQGMVAYGHVNTQTAQISAAPGFPLQINALLLQRVADLMQQFNFMGARYDVHLMVH
jgi:NitT/TauT family transport system substrate-binding protein